LVGAAIKEIRTVGFAIKESDTGVMVSEENSIVWCNRAVFNFLGKTEKEVLGSFPWELNLEYNREFNNG
jgi:PAS domain-containing protein